MNAALRPDPVDAHEWLINLERATIEHRLTVLRETGLFGQSPAGSDFDKCEWVMNRLRHRTGVLDEFIGQAEARAAWCLKWADAVLASADLADDQIILRACQIIYDHTTDEKQRNRAIDLFFLIRGELP